MGIRSNVVYYRNGNTLKSVDGSSYVPASVITHWRTSETIMERQRVAAPAIYDNVLQEVYIVFRDGNTGTVTIDIWVDGYYLTTRYFDSTLRRQKWLSQVARFKKIKFIITLPNTKVGIEEFGCSYVQDYQEMVGA